MFVDKTKINIKAGNGGNGAVSFLRDKNTMNGGPDGGSGGRGGHVIFEATSNMNNLVDFYYTKKYRAENGVDGGHLKCNGRNGEDLIIKVPCGTVVRDEETGNVVADLFYEGDRKVVLKGGAGGRGNSVFATPTRQAPAYAETGVKTKDFNVILELKTIADVGLIGFPSVGKSKILSVLTKAKPKIADYHFTTLTPNLGVASYDNIKFLMADIPGLIEGASEGKGLGFEFLRHVERTRMLVHVVDIAAVDGRNPIEDFVVINEELKKYSKELASVPQIVVLNKMDLIWEENEHLAQEFKETYGKDYKIFEFSAATLQGKNELLGAIVNTLATLPKVEPQNVEIIELDKEDKTSLEIVLTKGGVWEVKGGYVDELIRLINLGDTESFAYFQKRLKNDGILDKLVQKGLTDGDTIRVGAFEFTYYE